MSLLIPGLQPVGCFSSQQLEQTKPNCDHCMMLLLYSVRRIFLEGLTVNSWVVCPTHLQVWLCGGSMEVLPCSRVAHIARMKKPYHSNIAFHTRRNALRVAEVWMDQYKSNVYLAWNIPMEVREAVVMATEWLLTITVSGEGFPSTMCKRCWLW